MLEIDDLDTAAFLSIEKKYTDDMLPITRAIHDASSTLDEKIAYIKRLQRMFSAFHNECRCKSLEVFELFSAAYLRCRSDDNSFFAYIDPYSKQLKEYTENYAELKADEDYLKYELLMLPNRILLYIQEHKGVRQSELYKVFDPRLKLNVTELIYRFEKKHLIRRREYSNTYKLYINEDCDKRKFNSRLYR